MEFISRIIDFVITNKDMVIVIGFAVGFIWIVLNTFSRVENMGTGVGLIGILGIIECLIFGGKKFLMSLAILVVFSFAVIVVLNIIDKLHEND